MRNLIKFLEKFVFLIAGAMIIFIYLVSRSDAAEIDDSLTQHMTPIYIQHQTVVDRIG